MTNAETDGLSLIPLPKEARRKSGTFAITPETIIVADVDNHQNATYLRELLAPPTGFPLSIKSDSSGSTSFICLTTSGAQDELGNEGYLLDISSDKVRIEAPAPNGVFYGIQTLRQLLPAPVESRVLVHDAAWQAPCALIKDTPRFKWRGYMLDEGRHFLGKETVLRTLDLMALQKLNIFHWHLTEDQGWRIEIKGYPRLTEIGSLRKGTSRNLIGKHDGIPHGGYYSQTDIKEIVAFSAQRGITIVPEIEMPGHSKAALAAYPELSCAGGPIEVATRFWPTREIFCVGKEAVFKFLENVLDEVMALFPSRYIHLGGDEVLKGRWKKCPDCQRRMVEERLKNVSDLQPFFTRRIAGYLATHGRRLIGWNEILASGLPEDAIVQYWIRHRKQTIEAIQSGRDVVVSSFRTLYLDHSYSLTPLSKAYGYEPVFPELDASTAKHVLGLEAPLWTEWVPNQERQDFQTYPRLTAFAETGWSPRERKGFKDFQSRLAIFQKRLDVLGVKYAQRQDVEPPWFKQLFGLLTIAQPQTKIA